MSACFNSILRPSLVVSDYRWLSNPNPPPPVRFTLRRPTNYTSSRHIRRVIQDGAGVLLPDDTVSLETPAVIDNGVVSETLVVEEKIIQSPPPTKKLSKKEDDTDSSDTRFKLRNGREVSSLSLIVVCI